MTLNSTTVLTIFTVLFLLLAQVLGQESSALRGHEKGLHYSQVLVFDAGSSGTRIHVFNLAIDGKGALVPTIDLAVREKQTKKIKPGLSSYAENDDLDGAEKSIEGLLQFANGVVPQERRKSTPVLLKATAGLRSVRPASKAKAVLDRVRQKLSSSGYLFKPEWADIIKGKEEAGLAWIAANYLQGTLQDAGGSKPSIGVIEMGGGSTQVTFEVGANEASKVAHDDRYTFTNLAGRSFHLYAHSYLGYGQDHAQAKLRDLLPRDVASDPCYPPGYERPSIVTESESSAHSIKGTGQSKECQSLIKTLVLGQGQKTAPGKYSGELPLRGRFAATENFWFQRSSLKDLPKMSLEGGISAAEEAAKEGCSRKVDATDPDITAVKEGKSNPLKVNQCFGLCYQWALLEILQTGISSSIDVQVKKDINGGDIDWAMGAALVHFTEGRVNLYHEARAKLIPQLRTKSDDFLPTKSITVALFVVLCALGAGAYRFFIQNNAVVSTHKGKASPPARGIGKTNYAHVSQEDPDDRVSF